MGLLSKKCLKRFPDPHHDEDPSSFPPPLHLLPPLLGK